LKSEKSREATRHSQCSNDLRQIGIVCLNHENVYQSLPPDSDTIEANRNYSLFVFILLFMEQEALYETIAVNMQTQSSWQNEAYRVVLKQLRCPSDPNYSEPVITSPYNIPNIVMSNGQVQGFV
jgi:hypothetical protein